MARKNVEDQLRSVDDSDFEFALEVTLLRGRQFIIEDDEVRIDGGDRAHELFDLPFSNQRG